MKKLLILLMISFSVLAEDKPQTGALANCEEFTEGRFACTTPEGNVWIIDINGIDAVYKGEK